MKLSIRETRREDCPQLLELIKELAEFEKAPEEVTVTLEEFEEAGFGERPVWKAFAAEADGKIVALALYYVRYSTWKGQRLYLEDIIVTESMRCKGIGGMLFDRIVQEAKEKCFNGITWQVLDWNEPAIRFYKKYNAAFDGEWVNVSLSKEQIHHYQSETIFQ